MDPIRPGNDDHDRCHDVHDVDDGRADDDFDIDHDDGGADHLDVDDDFDVDHHDGGADHDHHGTADDHDDVATDDDDHDGCADHDHHRTAADNDDVASDDHGPADHDPAGDHHDDAVRPARGAVRGPGAGSGVRGRFQPGDHLR